jgi:hypothetical protein
VRRRLGALWPTWVALAVVAAVWLALGGGSPLRSLGGYGDAGGYSPLRVLELVAEHAGDLLIVCGIVPLCGVVLLAATRPAAAALQTTVAVVLAAAASTVVAVGVFAAGHADRLVERGLLPVLPSVLVGFVAWLGSGARRPRGWTPGVAGAVLAGLIAMPIGALATDAALADNPSLVRLIQLDSPQAYGLTAFAAGLACLLLLRTPPRALWLLPATVGATFVAASVVAAHEFAHQSRLAEAKLAAPRDWIDRDADGPVTYLYDGAGNWQRAWSQAVWNERLTRVLDLTPVAIPGPLPQAPLQVLADDGALRLVGGSVPRARLVVAPRGLRMRGEVVERDRASDLVLWRLAGPATVVTWTQGLQPNGDITGEGQASLDVFDCGRGRFHVVAIGRDNAKLTLAQDGTAVATADLWPHGVWERTLETTGSHGRCTFSLSASSLVHLSEFSWVRG